jgi:NAD(P)-dependent dehydrogenase (short-subunit alcohol dehydrogenase family)
MRIADTLAVVTGAGSGIGRATAQQLAAKGARLAISDIDPTGLEQTRSLLGGACVHAQTLDVGDRAAFAAYAETLATTEGPAAILVNNAGVGLAGRLVDMRLEDWDWLLRINLMGVVHGCHFFAPQMVATGKGQIVNIASMLGFYPVADAVPYCTSKFAVLGLSECLRVELAPAGVGVSAICPGLVRTNIAKASRTAKVDPKEHASAVRAFETRGADPDLIATAVLRAIRHDIGVLPVTREAWALWWARRAAPAVARKAARWVRWSMVR